MTNEKSPPLNPDSPAVLNYLTTLQGIITRFAANSGSCKTLCVTLVSAIVVVITNKAKPEFAGIAFLPIVSLAILDAYYLGLERSFRNTYHNFTQKLLNNSASTEDLFKLIPTKKPPKWVEKIKPSRLSQAIAKLPDPILALTSSAIWLFYLPLGTIVFMVKNG
jgi:hypothetical protein